MPRRDVPGLRFVKTAVRFANNPSPVKGDKITLGNIVDMGIIQNNTYDIDVNSLVRHTLVAGATGSGKSTTCKRILTEVMERNIPVMVIEPAKDDYVRWAININKTLPNEKQFKIFMPGVDEFEGTHIEKLCINPFEPAAFKGANVDLLQHSEYFSVLLNACLPSEDVVPILIEEVVYETIREIAIERNIRFEDELVKPLNDYPTVDSMLIKAKEIMRTKTYADRNKDNLTEVLMTRFKTLKRGMRGRILNVYKSTDYNMLFSNNVIINLSVWQAQRINPLLCHCLCRHFMNTDNHVTLKIIITENLHSKTSFCTLCLLRRHIMFYLSLLGVKQVETRKERRQTYLILCFQM